MSWKASFGHVAARVVQGVALLSRGTPRPLTGAEREMAAPIFDVSLDLSKVRVHEGVSGLLNVSRRAFVIEQTIYLPVIPFTVHPERSRGAAFRAVGRPSLDSARDERVADPVSINPPRYLPLRTHVLVHELCHVWQFQNGGHAYIGDSVHAQLLGDGYELEKGLLQGRVWAELNAEQQATLIEASFVQGCFEGKPFLIRGRDWTKYWGEAVVELRAGRGAAFTSA